MKLCCSHRIRWENTSCLTDPPGMGWGESRSIRATEGTCVVFLWHYVHKSVLQQNDDNGVCKQSSSKVLGTVAWHLRGVGRNQSPKPEVKKCGSGADCAPHLPQALGSPFPDSGPGWDPSYVIGAIPSPCCEKRVRDTGWKEPKTLLFLLLVPTTPPMLQTDILLLFVMALGLSLTFPFSGSLRKLPQKPKLKRKRIKEAPETPETCLWADLTGTESLQALGPRALVRLPRLWTWGKGTHEGKEENCLYQKDT